MGASHVEASSLASSLSFSLSPWRSPLSPPAIFSSDQLRWVVIPSLSSSSLLSLFPSLSSLKVSFSPHLVLPQSRQIANLPSYNYCTRYPSWLRRSQNGGPQLGGSPNTAVVAGDWRVAEPCVHGGGLSSSGEFDDGSGSQQVHLNLFIKKVPSVLDENARIVDTISV